LLLPPAPTLFPYTTLFRSVVPADIFMLNAIVGLRAPADHGKRVRHVPALKGGAPVLDLRPHLQRPGRPAVVPELRDDSTIHGVGDRKSTRLNSSHVKISYA